MSFMRDDTCSEAPYARHGIKRRCCLLMLRYHIMLASTEMAFKSFRQWFLTENKTLGEKDVHIMAWLMNRNVCDLALRPIRNCLATNFIKKFLAPLVMTDYFHHIRTSLPGWYLLWDINAARNMCENYGWNTVTWVTRVVVFVARRLRHLTAVLVSRVQSPGW